MRYSTIGNVKKPVAVIAMGTDKMGSRRPEELSMQQLDKYYAMGGNFIDTARVYGQRADGVSMSETTVGKWIRSRGVRDSIVLGTKGAHYSLVDRHRRVDHDSILADCEASLRDLGLDFIDLYWLHRDDDTRPVAEIMETLNELVKKGYVGALGASNWSAERLREANAYAAAHGLLGFTADQPQWSMARRVTSADDTLIHMYDDLYAFHRESGIACIPYSSQAQGYFSKMDALGEEGLAPGLRRDFDCEDNRRRLPVVQRIASAHHTTVAAVGLAYLTCQPFHVFPIAGASNLEQMDDIARGSMLILSENELREIENA